ncbi:MAG: hypothetical protein H6999_05155 [Hahellaceae bacterium]|nr:hypothetical protein [Hahellaceae bacterium]MCP5169125.1 hypothetical protein [Hahellaceae bacterium]
MQYYYLFAKDNGENVMLSRQSHRELNPKSGAGLDEAMLGNDAIVFSVQAGEDYGYDQYDPDYEGAPEALNLNQRMLDYYEHDSLMSERLLKAIGQREEIQTFPVRLDNSFNDEPLTTNYCFVNITKSFDCEDIAHSDSPAVIDDPSKLVVDESKTGHSNIFRLRPFVSTIVVSEDIATAINRGSFNGVVAYPLPHPG